MPDLTQLKQLKENNKISESEFCSKKGVWHKKSLGRGSRISPRSGIVYIIAAFFMGSTGLHNFYAGYWKRGLTQLALILISPLFSYLPLIFTSCWSMLELLFINRDAKGLLMTADRRIILILRIVAVLVFAFVFSSSELIWPDENWDILQQI